jgi:hypothetical protein
VSWPLGRDEIIAALNNGELQRVTGGQAAGESARAVAQAMAAVAVDVQGSAWRQLQHPLVVGVGDVDGTCGVHRHTLAHYVRDEFFPAGRARRQLV